MIIAVTDTTDKGFPTDIFENKMEVYKSLTKSKVLNK